MFPVIEFEKLGRAFENRAPFCIGDLPISTALRRVVQVAATTPWRWRRVDTHLFEFGLDSLVDSLAVCALLFERCPQAVNLGALFKQTSATAFVP